VDGKQEEGLEEREASELAKVLEAGELETEHTPKLHVGRERRGGR
jgi:hypothetical protein